MKIAVAGGTGTVGRMVVEVARERGHDVVVLSRADGVDLIAGVGVDAALDGVVTVIDVVSTPAAKAAAAMSFFETVTRTLCAAERRAGVAHHLALSIVGIDRIPPGFGYYAGKLAQERAVEAGGVPWTILRATQFHEFARQTFERMRRGPLVFAPAMRTQPIAAAEVARRLVDLAEQQPAGRTTDLAGPRVERLAELCRAWASAAERPGHVVEVPLPGAMGRSLRQGGALPGPEADLGTQTFAQWLEAETGGVARSGGGRPGASGAIGGLFGGSGFRIVGQRPEAVPEPTLSNVDDLVTQLRASGMAIALEVEGEPRRLAADVDAAAFRALQEGVGIVLMRTPRADATATVRYLPHSVEVEVAHGPATLSRHAAQVTGLTRTRESVHRLGGAVTGGATDDGGFRVTATLPTPV